MNLSNAQKITRKSGSNLALAFFCLPKAVKDAMSVFYAFCRVVDDIVDEVPLDAQSGKQKIQEWREEIARCYSGNAESELGRELATVIRQHDVPKKYFDEILNGVEMDLTHRRYKTFEELSKYCYRVASAVGLVSIRIFGCRQPQSEDYAVALGMAFQLTNILRDVRHDLETYGRIYLPQDELRALGVTEDDLKNHSAVCEKLFRLQYFRAKHFYNRARRLIHPEDREHLAAALVMTEVYEGLLEKIRRRHFKVLEKKIRLNFWEKVRAIRRGGRAKKIHAAMGKPLRAAVWGGGFAGFSAALALARDGHTVDLYEAKSYLGGRAHSFREAKTGQVLDNGQHIFMGCYHACMALFEMLGVSDKLHRGKTLTLDFFSTARGHTRLKAALLPPPLHLLAALAGFKELSWRDRLAILWMGGLMRVGSKPKEKQTVAAWLSACGQTQGSIRALWEPLCLAALNEPIQTACANLFYKVARRSIFGSREDSAIVTSTVGLSELFIPEAKIFLEATGGRVYEGYGIRELRFRGDAVQSFTTSVGETVQRDIYVSALPWGALASLLPTGHALRKQIEQIPSAPIVGIYLWTDKPLIKESVVGLLDSPIQWIFNRTLKAGDYVYALVISGAYAHLEKGSEEILNLVSSELKRLFPEFRGTTIRHSFIYKARDATFAARPEVAAHRPNAITPWKNLFLAGDWTATALPGTMEGAVVSGTLAAKAIENALTH